MEALAATAADGDLLADATRKQSLRVSGGSATSPPDEKLPAPSAEEVALQIAQENFLRQQMEAEQEAETAAAGPTASKLERAKARAKMAKAMLSDAGPL